MKAVMLMFDTLSRNFLPNFGNDWVYAPNFERLQKKTITFDNFYAGSLPCMPARRELHTGRYNFMHRSWGQLEPFDYSVFDTLMEKGVYSHLITDHSHYYEDGGATYHNRYSTWEGFRGQEGDRWVPRKLANKSENTNPLNKTGLSPIQHFANRTRQRKEEDMSSVQTIMAGIEFLENYKDEKDWFLQIECFDPHEPFYVPEKYRERYYDITPDNQYFWPVYGEVSEDISEDDLIQLQKEYAALISMCDNYLGKVLDMFDENNMWEDTMLIVNTDHGFLLGEHGWIGKNVSPLYEEIVHLPFFISVPGQKRNTVNTNLTQTIDIPATLLDYFGVENYLDMDGESLLTNIDSNDNAHNEVIFGINGGFVNIYDGRYVYMRASVNPNNRPRKIQTLNYNNPRGFLSKKELDSMILKEGNRFTNQYPYVEIEMDWVVDSYSTGHLLFDLKEDPNQLNPISNAEIEKEMTDKLTNIMKKIEAPDSEFERLGLDN